MERENKARKENKNKEKEGSNDIGRLNKLYS